MKLTVLLKSWLLLALAAALAACGGGGGGNDVFNPPSLSISATASPTTVSPGGRSDITVRVTQNNGSLVTEAVTVEGSLSNSSRGTLGVATGDGGIGGSTGTTSGGVVNFRFQAGTTPGPVTLTFRVASGASTPSTSITVTIGGGPDERLRLEATRTELPANIFNVSPFLGSPYMSEVTVFVQDADGNPVNEEDGIQVSVNPVGNTGGYTTLDDGETEDVNEFLQRMGQGPVDVVAGRATIFFHSLEFTGTSTLTVTTQDPVTEQTVSASLTFTIVATAPPLPASVEVSSTPRPVYVQGSGGNTSGQIEIAVFDGNGEPVEDPVEGNNAFNNVLVDIVGDGAANGETVSGLDAAGQSVSGTSIEVRTTNGIAGAVFNSGDRLGPTIIRVTADRADNNVDNGIQDPVTGQRTVIVSDGKLFSIKLTSPNFNAIRANVVDPGVELEDGEIGSLDGTYSLTVSVIATDRQGNPVLDGTPIEFGLIDEPLEGFPLQGAGFFSISGGDGNPQEGGSLFTAPSGEFNTAGGGAGPGDTLVVFGEEVPGNRDLESARTIAQVNSQTSLTVVQEFNDNDDTGATVDFGNVLPYVIGRATDGNIGATAITDDLGVATTTMNYPVSMLGKGVVIWARGSAPDGDDQKLITDADTARFAGIAPLTLSASPSRIPGNTSTFVTVCVQDAFGSPIQGAFVGFGFGLESGSGSVDGQPNAGTLDTGTNASGCALAEVETSGMTEDGDDVVEFSVGSAEPAEVEIDVSDELILQASPTAFIGNGTFTVNLRLIDGSGNPVEGVAISGTCTGDGDTAIVSITEQPAPTDADGETFARVTASQMDQPEGGAEWTCTFALGSGEPSAEVLFKGRDSCAAGSGFSPPAPVGACDDETDPEEAFNVTVNVDGVGTAGGNVTSAPSGISCPVTGGGDNSCTFPFPESQTVTLAITVAGAAPHGRPTATGDCNITSAPDATGPVFTAVLPPRSSPQTCNITLTP